MKVAGHQLLQSRFGIGTFQSQHAHVGDVKHPQFFAHGPVLLNQTAELHRHLPAGERHHPSSAVSAELMKRRALQRHPFRCGESHSYGGLQQVEANPEIGLKAWSISQTVTSVDALRTRDLELQA